MDCSLPGSSVHGISLARIPDWVAISFSRGTSRPRDWTQVSCKWIASGFFTTDLPGRPILMIYWRQILLSSRDLLVLGPLSPGWGWVSVTYLRNQLPICWRLSSLLAACRACFHKQCFQSSKCPRCARITARRRLLESLPSAATWCTWLYRERPCNMPYDHIACVSCW